MLLQKLREYSDRLEELPPTLYSEGPVRYVVELDGSGRLLNRHLTDLADPSSPRTKRGQRRPLPALATRTSNVKPLLLAHNAEYTLGLGRRKSKAERVKECHRAFVELVQRCAASTGDPAVIAVQSFLQSESLKQLDLDHTFDPDATVTFRVDGVFPIDLPSVQAFWARMNDPEARNAPIMQCLVCGQERPALDRLQLKIKGVPDGDGKVGDAALISANAEAFESYGLKASLIAPTCAECGELFTQAANELLGSEQNSIRVGGAAFVFWTREETGFNFRTLLTDPQVDEVRALIDSVRKGRRPDEKLDATQFYATALSRVKGRVIVRDWLDTTVGEVKQNLAGPNGWFSRQRIVGPHGEEPRPLGLYPLAAATVRDARDLAPPVPRALVRAALLGTPVPSGLLHQTFLRCRVGERQRQGGRVHVTRPQAAVMKLVVISQETNEQEEYMIQLDSENPSPGYRCGRLMAVLEQAQRLAIPGIKASIVDRFFGTASSAPASVFPRLVRGAQPHLAKLERDKRGAFIALQRRLEEIQAHIPATGYPRTLALEDQGLFALGYYHQRAHDRAQAREAAEKRKAGEAGTEEADLAEALEANDSTEKED